MCRPQRGFCEIILRLGSKRVGFCQTDAMWQYACAPIGSGRRTLTRFPEWGITKSLFSNASRQYVMYLFYTQYQGALPKLTEVRYCRLELPSQRLAYFLIYVSIYMKSILRHACDVYITQLTEYK